MYWQFGNYKHSENEVDMTSLNIQRMFSPRNTLAFQRHTLVLMGHMCVTGQDAIKSAIQEIEEAYRVLPGGPNSGYEGWKYDAGLYHDDGTPSAHFLDASKSINGVRLLSLSYPKESGGEYATGRSYSIVMQADFLNVEDQIWSFAEQIQHIGNCGPQWELVPVFYGPPRKIFVHEWTVQRIVQSGTAVGIQAHPYIPAEILPDWKHNEQSFYEYGSPQMIGRLDNMLFPVRWRYVFSSPLQKDLRPHPDYPGH
jgi:hypothetical protein